MFRENEWKRSTGAAYDTRRSPHSFEFHKGLFDQHQAEILSIVTCKCTHSQKWNRIPRFWKIYQFSHSPKRCVPEWSSRLKVLDACTLGSFTQWRKDMQTLGESVWYLLSLWGIWNQFLNFKYTNYIRQPPPELYNMNIDGALIISKCPSSVHFCTWAIQSAYYFQFKITIVHRLYSTMCTFKAKNEF